jgi:hypothetical protein
MMPYGLWQSFCLSVTLGIMKMVHDINENYEFELQI